MSRCGVCGRRSPGYDGGAGRRRWRGPGLRPGPYLRRRRGTAGGLPRAWGHGGPRCPGARHRAGHTYSFDQTVAWLATHTSKAATCELMRTAWRTVGAIVDRVWADTEPARDPLAGLGRMGIDEDVPQEGPRDADGRRRPRLPAGWCGRPPAGTRPPCPGFFDLLGSRSVRAGSATLASDAAGWIGSVVTRVLPGCGPVRGPVPRGRLGHRSAGHAAAGGSGIGRGPPKPLPVGAVRKPRRAPKGRARLKR